MNDMSIVDIVCEHMNILMQKRQEKYLPRVEVAHYYNYQLCEMRRNGKTNRIYIPVENLLK